MHLCGRRTCICGKDNKAQHLHILQIFHNLELFVNFFFLSFLALIFLNEPINQSIVQFLYGY